MVASKRILAYLSIDQCSSGEFGPIRPMESLQGLDVLILRRRWWAPGESNPEPAD